ncbi:MAG: 50S ribosomal protein L25 [Syntrophorhabdaceae bacterium]|jgi:large subunit ribosomal protein L25|nr:50S ribosomal protein L25 [Syntrophorhabdales bacterium]MBP9561105.1 50S ribosomal protein L25 [Syntrophorhabdaceae bacterium]
MEETIIKADIRKGSGKSVARKLREQGHIPAVLYGRDTQTQMITVSAKEWKKLSKHLKRNAILKMQIQKNGGTIEMPVMVKDVQREVCRDNIIHIDFLHVSMERKIQVEIPIHLVGEAKGLINNGIIEQHLMRIVVECLPTQIPDKIDVDITDLDIGDSIHISDISYPGLRFLENPEIAIVTVIPPETEEKVAAEEETEPEKKEA